MEELSFGGVSLLLYYGVGNLLLFLVMGWDKLSAKQDWRRVPERRLLGAGLAFGGIGGLAGMLAFHHKTRKLPFWLVFSAAIFLHLWLWLWLWPGA